MQATPTMLLILLLCCSSRASSLRLEHLSSFSNAHGSEHGGQRLLRGNVQHGPLALAASMPRLHGPVRAQGRRMLAEPAADKKEDDLEYDEDEEGGYEEEEEEEKKAQPAAGSTASPSQAAAVTAQPAETSQAAAGAAVAAVPVGGKADSEYDEDYDEDYSADMDEEDEVSVSLLGVMEVQWKIFGSPRLKTH